MDRELTAPELRRRAIDGIAHEVAAFATGHPDSSAFRRDGLVASFVPACPERSLFNSVFYSDPRALAEGIDELERMYADRGIRAWTVWVPDSDRTTAGLLAERGHALDGAPRAMGLDLARLAGPPPNPDGFETTVGEPATAGRLNDLAYEHGAPAWAAALGRPTVPPIEWTFGILAGEVCGCVGAIPAGDDIGITGVATPPGHRGRGVAGAIMHEVLATARARGLGSASLQASRAGAPLYERLGFEDLGYVELWERRPGG